MKRRRPLFVVTALAVTAGCAAGVWLASGAPAYAQQPRSTTAVAAAKQDADNQEIRAVYRMADDATSGRQTPADFPIRLQTDFLKAQGGRVWMPLTITLDPAGVSAGPLTLYIRVAPRGHATVLTSPAAPPSYPFEDVALLDLKRPPPGEALHIPRGIGVPPGSYDLYVALRERGPTGRASVLKHALDVPSFAGPNLLTSSVILAERLDTLDAPIPTERQSEHPYAFGNSELIVPAGKRFRPSQELIVVFHVYNPTITGDRRFALQATYTFYRQDAGRETRFNSTEPQALNNATVPFDPTDVNSTLLAGQAIPLQGFSAGAYRLEITVTDLNSTKSLTRNVAFTVAP